MAEKTREQLRREMGERKVNPESLVSQKDLALQAEEERMRREMDGDSPTPEQEIEEEMRGSATPPLIHPKTGVPIRPQLTPEVALGVAARVRAAIEARRNPPEASGVDGRSPMRAVIENSYRDFAQHHEPETARALTQAYAMLELALAIDRIGSKL